MLQNSSSKRKLRQAAAKRPLKAKVVVLGDSGVGKTSILLRHDGQGFTSLLSSTLGASYVCSKSIHGGREVELQIVPLYLRGAVAAVLVYDITNKHSFNGIESWIDEVTRTEAGAKVALFIMANKADLDKSRSVSEREGRELAEKKGAYYFETSALNGKGIETAMVLIAEDVLHRNTAKSPALSANDDDQPGVSSSPGIHLHTSPWTSHRSHRKQSATSNNAESDEDDNVASVGRGSSNRRPNKGNKSGGSGFGGCCAIF